LAICDNRFFVRLVRGEKSSKGCFSGRFPLGLNEDEQTQKLLAQKR